MLSAADGTLSGISVHDVGRRADIAWYAFRQSTLAGAVLLSMVTKVDVKAVNNSASLAGGLR